MNKNKLIYIVGIAVVVVIFTFGIQQYVHAGIFGWTAPQAAAPACVTGDLGCYAPVNISSAPQAKTGALSLGNLADPGNFLLNIKATSSFTGAANFTDVNAKAGGTVSLYGNGGQFYSYYDGMYDTAGNEIISPVGISAVSTGASSSGAYILGMKYGARIFSTQGAIYARGNNFGLFATNDANAAGEWNNDPAKPSNISSGTFKPKGLYPTLVKQGKHFAAYLLGNVAINDGSQSGASASNMMVLTTTDSSNGTTHWVPASTLGSGCNTSVVSETSFWDSSTANANNIHNLNSGNIGIGTNAPAFKLDVNGTVSATGLKIATGAGNGKVLTSDGSGNAAWEMPQVVKLTSGDCNSSTCTIDLGSRGFSGVSPSNIVVMVSPNHVDDSEHNGYSLNYSVGGSASSPSLSISIGGFDNMKGNGPTGVHWIAMGVKN